VLVLDLGGGTIDLALVALEGARQGRPPPIAQLLRCAAVIWPAAAKPLRCAPGDWATAGLALGGSRIWIDCDRAGFAGAAPPSGALLERN